MKIRYVKNLIFILCITVISSSRGTGNTLAEILALYPRIQGMSLEYANEQTGKQEIKKGAEIVEFLSQLSTLPKAWVESTYRRDIDTDEKISLETIARSMQLQRYTLPDNEMTPEQRTFLCSMVDKLLASGAKWEVQHFEECAHDPQFCLVFLKNLKKSNISLLEQGGKSDPSTIISKTVIEIIIDRMCTYGYDHESGKPKSTLPAYKQALKILLEQPDYKVSLRILEHIEFKRGCCKDTTTSMKVIEELLTFILTHGSLDTNNADNPFDIFAFLIESKQEALIPLLQGKDVKVNDIKAVARGLAQASHEKREEILTAIGPDQTLRSQVGAELIKQCFDRLTSRDDCVTIHGDVDQEALVGNIKKCVTHFRANLGEQVSFKSLKMHGCKVREWGKKSLYYYLMVCLAPELDEEHAKALSSVCSEWLEKQEESVREAIKGERNSYGQTALHAVLDFYSSPKQATYQSACAVISSLAKTGVDPLAKATQNYKFQGTATNSLDMLKKLQPPVRAAFNEGRKAAHLETYGELVPSSNEEDDPQGDKGLPPQPLPGVGASGNTLTPDTATSTSGTATPTLNNKSESLSPGTKNALIGVVVVMSLIGLFYGVRRVMEQDDSVEPTHNDRESTDLVVAS